MVIFYKVLAMLCKTRKYRAGHAIATRPRCGDVEKETLSPAATAKRHVKNWGPFRNSNQVKTTLAGCPTPCLSQPKNTNIYQHFQSLLLAKSASILPFAIFYYALPAQRSVFVSILSCSNAPTSAFLIITLVPRRSFPP